MAHVVEELDAATFEHALEIRRPTAWKACNGGMVAEATPKRGAKITAHYVRLAGRYFLLVGDVDMASAEAVRRVSEAIRERNEP
jgi:hypothetical protein